MNEDNSTLYSTVAEPPSSEKAILNILYPQYLTLKHLTIIHRHGDRTPLGPRFGNLFPKNWNFCRGSNNHHSSVLNFSDPFNKVLTPQTNMTKIRKETEFGNLKFQKLYEDKYTINLDSEKLISNCFYGQLTDKGRSTLHNNGASLRKIYVERLGFLPEYFEDIKQNELYLRSTKYERTIESLHQLMNGMYPQKYISKDNRAQDASEMIIRIREHKLESLYPDYSCRKISILFNKFKDLSKAHLNNRWLDLKKELLEKTKFKDELNKNDNQDMFMSIHQLFDTIYSAKSHGVMNVKGFDETKFIELDDLHTQLWFGGLQKSNYLLRLSVGRLFEELRHKTEKVLNNQTQEKLSVYSGHDTTIAPLLIGLKAFDNKWPQYGSMVTLELFEDKLETAKRYMRVKYNNKVLTLPECQITGNHHEKLGPTMCNIKTILKIFKSNEMENYDLECNSNEKQELAASLLSSSE